MALSYDQSYLVMLTNAYGRPVAIRNTEIGFIRVASDRDRLENNKPRGFVYDDVVALTENGRDNVSYYIKGPIEEVVFALNTGTHLYRGDK